MTRRSCGCCRRRSLAKLRREIEPVQPAALGRFLPAWHGVGVSSGASIGWRRSSRSWRGCRCPRASWSGTSCRPASGATTRGLLDELGAAGEVAWIGIGTLGRDDGRIALVRPDRLELYAAVPGVAPRPTPAPARRRRPRGSPASCGSTWWPAARPSTATCWRQPCGAPSLAAVGRPRSGSCSMPSGTSSGPARSPTTRSCRCVPCAGRRSGRERSAARPRLGASGRMGPPEGAGRWSLVADALATAVAIAGGRAPTETERRHALAMRVLDRHGVVTRDGVAAENVPAGSGGVRDPARA